MKQILYVVEDEKSAQFRYRVQNLKEALLKNKNWRITIVNKAKIDDVDIETVDLIVILRQTAKDNTILRTIRKAKKNKIKVLLDIDDLVFDYRDLAVLMRATNAKNFLYWIGYIWGIRRIAKRVDGFLVTNDFLGGKIRRSFGKPYKIIRNSLNRRQLDIAKNCREEKKESKDFIIGYFSGSPTHVKDFRLVESELIDFLALYKNAKVKVVGYMDFSDRMRELIKQKRVIVHKPVDYLKLQILMSEVDVNIAPLLINDFTNCKSELKFFEAAIVNVVTIASPTFVFKRAILDGKNGFLAKQGEWFGIIEYLYNNPIERKKIAKQAENYALEHYYGKELLMEVEKAYEFFTN